MDPKPLPIFAAENVFNDPGNGGSVRHSSACIGFRDVSGVRVASQCRHSRLAGGRCAENDFLGVVTTAGIDAVAADPGALGCERDEPVSDAGQARTCSVSHTRDVTCLNSRIHGSQSSSFACARVSSGCLLGACGVGSASAAVGSACLPAVRTRSFADVAASACGGMAVKHGHARNSVVSGGFVACAEVHQLQLGYV